MGTRVKESHGFVLSENGTPLFVSDYKPSTDRPLARILLCQPFGEEKQNAYRVLTHFCRSAALLDIEVIKFDYRGSGNSGGEHSDMSLSTNLEDLNWLIAKFKNSDSVPMGIMGIRLGAAYALHLACSERHLLNFMILWAPVIDTNRLLDQMLRSNLATQMARHGRVQQSTGKMKEVILGGGRINVEGYELTGDWYRSLRDFQSSEPMKFSRDMNCLVVEVGARRLTEDQALARILDTVGTQNSMITRHQVLWKEFWKESSYVPESAAAIENHTLDWTSSVAIADRTGARTMIEPPIESCLQSKVPSANGTSEETLSFGNPGKERFGILHAPARGFDDLLILINGGVKHCVGPHRLYVKIARALSKEGVGVLRFDPLGMGDSHGKLPHEDQTLIFQYFQNGGLTDDTVRVMQRIRQELGCKRIFLGGLCGGALTSLLVGAKDRQVAGIALLNVPVLYYGVVSSAGNTRGTSDNASTIIQEGGGSAPSRRLSEKLWRFMTGKSDYYMFWNTFRMKMRMKANTMLWKTDPALNRHFVKAWRTYTEAGRQMLLVFSEKDVYIRHFHDKFLSRIPGNDEREGIRKVILRNADHPLTESAHLAEFNRILLDWIKQ